MDDDDPDTLDRLLRWVYLLEHPQTQNKTQPWTSELDLYMLADKYGLEGLMDAARRSLLKQATTCAEQPSRFPQCSDDFVEAMEILYEDLPEREDLVEIRQSLIAHTAPVIAGCVRDQTHIQELLASIPDFAMALVEALATRTQGGRSSSFCSNSSSARDEYSDVASRLGTRQTAKPYIPMNEDSDVEYE